MNQEAYEDAMSNAEIAFTNRNYELALEWFQKALEENPNDLEALSRAGTVCVPLEKFDESFAYFQKTMELDPKNGDNAFNLGNAYFFHGEFGKALECYADAEQKGVSKAAKPRLYYQMAMLCSVRQDVKGALINLQKYEDTDETHTASMNPDVITEKIKLYMMANDYEHAAHYALQWQGVAPQELRAYMVYFSILMAKKDYDKAESTLNDAEQYADIGDDNQITIPSERVSLWIAQADANPEKAEVCLKKAYDTLKELLSKKLLDFQREELTLVLAEVCMKQNQYSEAITIATTLLPKSSQEVSHKTIEKTEALDVETAYSMATTLDEETVDVLAEETMEMIDEKINSGELDVEAVAEAMETAEVYYDEDGREVREYSEEVLTYLSDTLDESPETEAEPTATAPATPSQAPAAETPDTEEGSEKNRRRKDFYDRLYFVLLSCYAVEEDYESAYRFSSILKHSENQYYSYFGRYTEAFSMKKLADRNAVYSKADAQKKYDDAIAFFRGQMMKHEGSNVAALFRARMYAESGKFAKAEQMANLLTAEEKKAILAYINQCRKELQEHVDEKS